MNPGPCFDHGDCERRIADLEAQLAAERATTNRLTAVLHAAGLSPGLIACEACEQAYLPAEQTSQECPWCRLMFAQEVAAEEKARADAAEKGADDAVAMLHRGMQLFEGDDVKIAWIAEFLRAHSVATIPLVLQGLREHIEWCGAKIEHYAHLAGAREREGRHRAEAVEARTAMLEEALRELVKSVDSGAVYSCIVCNKDKRTCLSSTDKDGTPWCEAARARVALTAKDPSCES